MKTPQHSTVLLLDHVGYYYTKLKSWRKHQRFWVLKDVSFELRQGDSLGVIGRNGVGKTTLLKILAGITAPDRGRLIEHGYSTSLLSLAAGFIPYLTGRENAILNGLILGIPKQTILAALEAIKAFSGLDEFFEQPLNAYSTGMKARLGFSIAFQLDPDILLIDEVIGVGDAPFKEKSAAVMKQKIQSDKTVVLVSHNASIIKELCNRAVWIEGGVSRAAGPVDDVLKEYNDFITHAKS